MSHVDENKLNQFVEQMLNDLGGAYGLGLVRIGDTLDLYRTLQRYGPMTSHELSAVSGMAERYLREWLAHHAAANYLTYDPLTQRFTLPPEQAMVFADQDSPVYMMGAFDAAAAFLENQPLVTEGFRSGKGVAWGNQAGCLFCAVAKFFRPGYRANLVENWLPAMSGVVEKLQTGAKVADVGCGHGHSTMLMAEAFPNSEFIGFDFHESSISQARKHVAKHGTFDNLRFEVGNAKDFPGNDYDLVTFFDCLHDMGDPAGAALHVRHSLKPDGSWMIVEPFAHDNLEQNLNPVGRLFYAASTMVCVPTSLDQEVGAAIGAQAGEATLRNLVVKQGGFSYFQRATETPFNLILEARP